MSYRYAHKPPQPSQSIDDQIFEDIMLFGDELFRRDMSASGTKDEKATEDDSPYTDKHGNPLSPASIRILQRLFNMVKGLEHEPSGTFDEHTVETFESRQKYRKTLPEGQVDTRGEATRYDLEVGKFDSGTFSFIYDDLLAKINSSSGTSDYLWLKN